APADGRADRNPRSPGCGACRQHRNARTTRSPESARGVASWAFPLPPWLASELTSMLKLTCRISRCNGGHWMTAVMQGVRILEVAEHTFVPAASALMSDWGAEVIKIEHVERGDAMRALASTGVALIPNDVHILLEHSNRGKKSLGLDLTSN